MKSVIDHKLETNRASEMKSTISRAFSGNRNGSYLPLGLSNANFFI